MLDRFLSCVVVEDFCLSQKLYWHNTVFFGLMNGFWNRFLNRILNEFLNRFLSGFPNGFFNKFPNISVHSSFSESLISLCYLNGGLLSKFILTLLIFILVYIQGIYNSFFRFGSYLIKNWNFIKEYFLRINWLGTLLYIMKKKSRLSVKYLDMKICLNLLFSNLCQKYRHQSTTIIVAFGKVTPNGEALVMG